MDVRVNRFFVLSALTLLPLSGLTLWLDARWWVSYEYTFLYFLGIGMLAKAVGDAWYYTFSPERRHWLYIEDYLIRDLLVQLRFVFPLACAQAYLANQALLYVPTLWLIVRVIWVSPVAGVVAWALNRYQVELAEEQRHRPVGAGAANLTKGRGGDPGTG